MAFSVLASKTGNITIDDKNVVDKTYLTTGVTIKVSLRIDNPTVVD